MSIRICIAQHLSFFTSLTTLLLLLTGSTAQAGQAESTAPTVGLHEAAPSWFALTGARVVVRPGEVLEGATIVVREGRITAVGTDVEPPTGAKQIDLTGKTVYAGFIESFSQVDISSKPPGTAHWNSKVVPQRAASASFAPDAALDEALRKQGFAARLVVPQQGILKGISCLALTDGGQPSQSVIAEQVAAHLELTVPFSFGGSDSNYPSSPMGAVAIARQALLDAAWHRDAIALARTSSAVAPHEANLALESLAEWLSGGRLVIAEASNELFVLRADRFAREFALRLAVRGSGNEYRRLEEIAATGRTLIVPVDFPKPPPVAAPEEAADATLEELMHWRLAPENPGRLRSAGVTIALTSHGLNDRGEFLQRVRKAVKRGLSADDALAALTTVPAELLGAAQQLGTIEKGKFANLIVVDGELFADKSKVLSTWVAGQEFEIESPAPAIVGSWKLAATGIEQPVVLKISGTKAKLNGSIGVLAEDKAADEKTDVDNKQDESDDATEAENEKPKQKKSSDAKLKEVQYKLGRLTARVDGKLLGIEGNALLALTLIEREDNATLAGTMQSVGGEAIVLTASQHEVEDADKKDTNEKDAGKKDIDKKPTATVDIDVEVNYPLGAYGRAVEPEQPQVVLFRNATVWTCAADGRLERADVLVRRGVIEAVGTGLDVPADAMVIDAAGKHLTPGIIDCHSHMATDSGLNEATQAVTAEVRIADFMDPDDITIYRQLAGGVTAANVLHGSANPIGGQNQVIKLRWGGRSDALPFDHAPAGIKFALGENVKQSNWGERHTTRYPQTRMGVDEIMIDAFRAAQTYQAKHDAWRKHPVGPAPRRDLELETIAQILAGERWIHCHSYRQSEILALLRTLESFDITIGTLQHILEGYKVAPEMAAHGAMASSFADWWAYKYEVYDAIPYNGALMHRAGIVVSFNSDNDELGRHLNHEAAKAVKYGGVPPEEALKFVTLNPAKQLRVDQYVGSIEAGKHADLAMWDGPPLSVFSKCEQTWIDGRKYFDRQADQQLHAEQEALRVRLVQAVIDSKEPAAKPGENTIDPATLWPRHDEFCHGHDHGEGEH